MCFISLEDYILMRNGTTDGTDIDLLDEENLSGGIVENYIDVYTRSGELIKMPEGSTVLDFAFKIHDDLGLACKYALINNSPNRQPLYTRLVNNDKVRLVTQQDDTGYSVPCAKLRWLAYVNTERAKKSLIKYFERMYSN